MQVDEETKKHKWLVAYDCGSQHSTLKSSLAHLSVMIYDTDSLAELQNGKEKMTFL